MLEILDTFPLFVLSPNNRINTTIRYHLLYRIKYQAVPTVTTSFVVVGVVVISFFSTTSTTSVQICQ